MVNKLTDFQSLVYTSRFHIFAVTETWLSDCICDKEILPAGFNVYRRDRLSRGGGVLFAVDERLPATVLSTPANIEVLTIQVKCPQPVLFTVVYRPPNADYIYLAELFAYLHQLLINNCVVIMGDFNFPGIDWQTLSAPSQSSDLFCEFVYDNGLTQHISDPTHRTGNILDLLRLA